VLGPDLPDVAVQLRVGGESVDASEAGDAFRLLVNTTSLSAELVVGGETLTVPAPTSGSFVRAEARDVLLAVLGQELAADLLSFEKSGNDVSVSGERLDFELRAGTTRVLGLQNADFAITFTADGVSGSATNASLLGPDFGGALTLAGTFDLAFDTHRPGPVVVTAGSNTGNGTLALASFEPVSAAARAGTYTVAIVTPDAEGRDFELRDPDGQVVGRGVVGVPFEGVFSFSVEEGATALQAGDDFTLAFDGHPFLRVGADNPVASVLGASLSATRMDLELQTDTGSVSLDVAGPSFGLGLDGASLISVGAVRASFEIDGSGVVGELLDGTATISGDLGIGLTGTFDVQVDTRSPSHPFVRVEVGGATLSAAGQSIGADLVVERLSDSQGDPVLRVAVANAALALGDGTTDFVSVSQGQGFFLINPIGIAGRLSAQASFELPDPLALSASTVALELNSTSVAIEESLTLLGESIELALPAGPFLRVTVLGASLDVAGVALAGDFSFDQSAAGAQIVRVGAANVSLSYDRTGSDPVGIENAAGAFVLGTFIGPAPDLEQSTGLAGVVSGDVVVGGDGFSLGGSIGFRLNTTTLAINETVVVGERSFQITFAANHADTGSGPYFDTFGASLSLKIGDFVSVEGDFTFEDLGGGVQAIGSDQLEIFLGQGPLLLDDGSQNPSAIGIVVSSATVGLLSSSAGLALVATGNVSVVGTSAFSFSGDASVRVNTTSAQVPSTLIEFEDVNTTTQTVTVAFGAGQENEKSFVIGTPAAATLDVAGQLLTGVFSFSSTPQADGAPEFLVAFSQVSLSVADGAANLSGGTGLFLFNPQGIAGSMVVGADLPFASASFGVSINTTPDPVSEVFTLGATVTPGGSNVGDGSFSQGPTAGAEFQGGDYTIALTGTSSSIATESAGTNVGDGSFSATPTSGSGVEEGDYVVSITGTPLETIVPAASASNHGDGNFSALPTTGAGVREGSYTVDVVSGSAPTTGGVGSFSVAPTAGAGALEGTYTLTIGADGTSFDVVGPDAGAVGSGTLGVPFAGPVSFTFTGSSLVENDTATVTVDLGLELRGPDGLLLDPATGEIGTAYADEVEFTLQAGTTPFAVGDRFNIQIDFVPTFTVSDPSGTTPAPTGAVNTPFVGEVLFTLLEGETPLAAGDSFTISVGFAPVFEVSNTDGVIGTGAVGTPFSGEIEFTLDQGATPFNGDEVFTVQLTPLSIDLPAGPFLRIDVAGTTPSTPAELTLLTGQVLRGSFALEQVTDSLGGKALSIAVSDGELRLGDASNDFLVASDVEGFLVLLTGGMGGRLEASVSLDVQGASLSGDLVLEVNTTTGTFDESLTVGTRTIDLTLDTGQFVRVVGTGVALEIQGQTLSGDFSFERTTDGPDSIVAASISNGALSLGDGSTRYFDISAVTGDLVLRTVSSETAFAGRLAATFDLTLPEGSPAISLDTTSVQVEVNSSGAAVPLPTGPDVEAGPFARAVIGSTATPVNLTVLGQEIGGIFLVETRAASDGGSRLTLGAREVGLTLTVGSTDLLVLENGTGLFVLTPSGLAGTVSADIDSALSQVTIAGNFEIQVNNTDSPVVEMLDVGGAMVTLNVPAGPYLRVAVTGTDSSTPATVSAFGQTLSGNFVFEKSQVGGNTVIVFTANDVSLSLGAGEAALVFSNGSGQFVLDETALEGRVSGVTSLVGLEGVSFEAALDLEFRDVLASPVPMGDEEYLRVEGDATLAIGRFAEVQGRFRFEDGDALVDGSLTQVIAVEIAEASVFVGAPGAVGISLSDAMLALILFDDGASSADAGLAVEGSGNVALTGLGGALAVRGGLALRANTTGRRIDFDSGTVFFDTGEENLLQLEGDGVTLETPIGELYGDFVFQKDGTSNEITVSGSSIEFFVGDDGGTPGAAADTDDLGVRVTSADFGARLHPDGSYAFRARGDAALLGVTDSFAPA
jgi:hypothetical protein